MIRPRGRHWVIFSNCTTQTSFIIQIFFFDSYLWLQQLTFCFVYVYNLQCWYFSLHMDSFLPGVRPALVCIPRYHSVQNSIENYVILNLVNILLSKILNTTLCNEWMHLRSDLNYIINVQCIGIFSCHAPERLFNVFYYYFVLCCFIFAACSDTFSKCYTIVPKYSNWQQAQLECFSKNMTLVTMLSLSEMRFVKYLLRQKRGNDRLPYNYFNADFYVHIGNYYLYSEYNLWKINNCFKKNI